MGLFKPIPTEKKEAIQAKSVERQEAIHAKSAERKDAIHAKSAERKEARQTKAAAWLKTARFEKAEYLGGLPGTKPSSIVGTLYVNGDCVGVGAFGPKTGVVKWSDAQGVSFDSGTASKSRVGKALLIGVFALAAKKTQDDAHMTVFLKDGNAAIYHVKGTSGAALRAKVNPIMVAAGVHCVDDVATAVAAPSLADELTKLGALRDSGILTDEEFEVHKAKLLA
jgi:hypothetical protein